jgi:hypothetical protein
LDNEVRRELEAEIVCERSLGRRDFLEGPLRIINDTVVILDGSTWDLKILGTSKVKVHVLEVMH